MGWTGRASHAHHNGLPVMAAATPVLTAAPLQPVSWRPAKLGRARRQVVPTAPPQWGVAASRVASGAPDPSAPGVPLTSSGSGDGNTGTGSDCCG